MIYQIEDFLSEEDFTQLTTKVGLYNSNNPDFPGWKFGGYSSDETFNKPFWRLDVINDYFFSNYLFDRVQECIKKISGEEVRMDIVYLNGATFGQQGFWHTDCNEDDYSGRTFLVYANETWDEQWSGSTVLKNDDGEIVTVYPKPRNAVYFHGRHPHFSQSLSRDFYGLRVTVAYKLKLK